MVPARRVQSQRPARPFTLISPLTAGSHSWSVSAVDHAANSTAATGAPWTFTARECAPDSTGACAGNFPQAHAIPEYALALPRAHGVPAPASSRPLPRSAATASTNDCDGLVDCADPDCAAFLWDWLELRPEASAEPRPEAGPEPGAEPPPEPPLDAGVNGSTDARPDSPVATATGTSTFTGTPTNTTTGTATRNNGHRHEHAHHDRDHHRHSEHWHSHATTTGTSVGPEPALDAGPRDSATTDASGVVPDATAVTPVADASGRVVPDGGPGSIDAVTGGMGDAATGGMGDAATGGMGDAVAGGMGRCGSGHTRTAVRWPLQTAPDRQCGLRQDRILWRLRLRGKAELARAVLVLAARVRRVTRPALERTPTA